MEVIEDGLFNEGRLERIVFPSSVKRIGEKAFSECNYLTEIVFTGESQLEWIGPMAFYSTGIARFVAPKSLRVIREQAFACCKSLTEVELNEGLRVLGAEEGEEKRFAGVFNASALRRIVVPSTVRRVGGYCFYNCRELADVTLSRGIEVIGKESFKYCWFLQITIPRTVREIEEMPFQHVFNFVRVEFEPGSELQRVDRQDWPIPTVKLVSENAPPAALAAWTWRDD